jgi:hypothetical protein
MRRVVVARTLLIAKVGIFDVCNRGVVRAALQEHPSNLGASGLDGAGNDR